MGFRALGGAFKAIRPELAYKSQSTRCHLECAAQGERTAEEAENAPGLHMNASRRATPCCSPEHAKAGHSGMLFDLQTFSLHGPNPIGNLTLEVLIRELRN